MQTPHVQAKDSSKKPLSVWAFRRFGARFWLSASLIYFPCASAESLLTSVPSGAAVIAPGAIESILRQTLADQLHANIEGSKIVFETPPLRQRIQLPAQNPILREALGALGIQNQIEIQIDPIRTQVELPLAGLQLKIRQVRPQIFAASAKWKVTRLAANSRELKIRVPSGLFDQSFDLNARPVQIRLEDRSPPIDIEVRFQIELHANGTQVRLQSLETNIHHPDPSRHPHLDLQLGPLLINGRPLTLQVEGNQVVLAASESSIRKQIETLEPELTRALRTQLESEIQRAFQTTAEKFSKSPRYSLKLNTHSLISSPGTPPAVQKLLSGIEGEFVFSSIEWVGSQSLFSAQVHSHLCIEKKCLLSHASSAIHPNDFTPLAHPQGAGVLIFESWIQRVFNDPLFQEKIRSYYQETARAPGVEIAPSGVKLHLNPATQSVDVVFNLSIDIKKTELSRDANTNLKRFIERSKRNIGDAWELWFGTGKRVVIPVQVGFGLATITSASEGKQNLVIQSTLPFLTGGKILNSYAYPSNVDQLTDLVRADFMTAIQKTFESIIPKTIQVPIPHPIRFSGVSAFFKQIQISPNRGLLISTEIGRPPDRPRPPRELSL